MKRERKFMSHPTWVCGLKRLHSLTTACTVKSHPTWVCGLKHRIQEAEGAKSPVTPYVGVWIETTNNSIKQINNWVTPYVGVWIETPSSSHRWLNCTVTPYVGVWIETLRKTTFRLHLKSHPTWVCGLKHRLAGLC